ncbi:hypothetical protein GCM10012275_07080 [Longimycelium tulufanense]|uniref:Uncharacterized protein n=1 Tax=Longimycelium tulufanense TaxID=907463 RepID=A0A8J3CAR5_9PSEU|nr:hypothetical protein GCM10012275_07080 [Longimycelium tulufanense]
MLLADLHPAIFHTLLGALLVFGGIVTLLVTRRDTARHRLRPHSLTVAEIQLLSATAFPSVPVRGERGKLSPAGAVAGPLVYPSRSPVCGENACSCPGRTRR